MTNIPTEGPLFTAMMREVDAKLIAEGKDVASRPILAVREVSMMHKISIPMGGPSDRLPPDLAPSAPLGAAIDRWYKETYGDRLNIDMTPGCIVVRVDGDLYILRIPRMWGSITFILSREFIPKPGISRAPVTCNVVQLLEGMTPGKAAALSDEAIQSISAAFRTGLPAAYTLEGTDHELMSIARGDVATAVANLIDRGNRFGASKWASLQAAEKALKTAISLKGAIYKFSHGLEGLCRQLADLGVVFDAGLVADIQCKPGIRYGEEPCTRNEALAAHHASLELVNRLRDAGAGFKTQLG